MGVSGRAGMLLEMGSLIPLSVAFIVVPLQVDVKKTALALAITDSELSDEEASILESGGFSVSRATTPQLTDVSEGMGSPLSLLIFLVPVGMLAVLSGGCPHKCFLWGAHPLVVHQVPERP